MLERLSFIEVVFYQSLLDLEKENNFHNLISCIFWMLVIYAINYSVAKTLFYIAIESNQEEYMKKLDSKSKTVQAFVMFLSFLIVWAVYYFNPQVLDFVFIAIGGIFSGFGVYILLMTIFSKDV